MFKVKLNGNSIKTFWSIMRSKKNLPQAQYVLNNAILRDCVPFMPMVDGTFIQNTMTQARATIRTNKLLVGADPMGRYLYYGKVMVDEHGRGATPYMDEYGGIMFRHRKGAILHATDRDLTYSRLAHPQAGARWFEKAKALHLKDWTRQVKDTLLNGR